MTQPLRDHLASTDALLHAIDCDIFDAHAATISQDAYDRLIQQGLKANSELWDQAVKDLDALLQARIDGVVRRKHTIVAIACAMVLLVVYLLSRFISAS